MPIYNSKDLIPFVNQLEVSINNMNEEIADWNTNKYKLISSSNKVDSIQSSAMSALVRADEAMSEIGTATFKSTATRGKRLEDTLNKLRSDMYEIAESVEGSGGGGSLTEGPFFEELNNAIASVDATVEDGLKLDYRIRDIESIANVGVSLSKKELIVPYKYELLNPESLTLRIPEAEGVVFVQGEVTVLDEEGSPFLDHESHIITGIINEDRTVTLSAIPQENSILYFPVEMKFKDVPSDFLYMLVQQMVQKNSRVMEVVLRFESQITSIVEDIEYMKGVQWTPDFSIMRNHQELVKEGITPKGLHVEVKEGMAHVTFSYNEHPHLSHFVLEKLDLETGLFVPYDGLNGIVQR